ncbi:hypothetical protein DMB92_05350 [Campylobacter sp. MIT 99-7217]|uniref:hypothetical protein n=1 Tax=Campylobacter sp. MIT 99-7217 TaxID=535091 RepID=UPI001157119D|nr:hypothetical protein [Campylobacter sp. MIT 99-7217]TQR31815.1 hypothetical protein DMB92_05350 [Campylobacter sp. MIT 99-7217]
MLVKDFLQRLRRRLIDEGFHAKFSDEELLASLNQEQNILISDFEMNVQHFSKQISSDDNVLHLPKLALKIVHARLNAKAIPLKNYKYALENENPTLHVMSYSNMQSLAVLPQIKANGLFEVWVNLCVFQDDENENLFLNDLFVNALLYSCFKNVLQSENSEFSLQKMNFYEALFEKESSRLKKLVSDTREKQVFFSKVSRV